MDLILPSHLVWQHQAARNPYNDPRCWTAPEIERPATDYSRTQQRLDQNVLNDLAGGTENGLPYLRFGWGPTLRTYAPDGSIRRMIRFTTLELSDGRLYDLPVPRWILVERIPRAICEQDWEARRWVKDPATGQSVDTRGECPKQGIERFLRVCADHNDLCCRRTAELFQAGRVPTTTCWGWYRPPTQEDLEAAGQAAAWLREHHLQPDPQTGLTPAQLAQVARNGKAQDQAQIQRREDLQDEVLRQVHQVSGWKSKANTEKQLRHGRYHFVKGLK